MSSLWKTTRLVLISIAVIAGGFWTSVTFLGQNWSDQAHYLWTLFNMLLLIVISAAVLLGVFKLVAFVWNKLIMRAARNNNEVADQDDNPQE